MRHRMLPAWARDRHALNRGLRVLAVGGLSATVLVGPYDPHQTPAGPPGLSRWPAAVAAVAPGSAVPDPVNASPSQIASFFGSLNDEQGRALAEAAPGVVGNTDGVPYPLRYAANDSAQRLDGEKVRPLLAYDPSGDGRAVGVVGDLARAGHVAVLVPGTGWNLPRLLGSPAGISSPDSEVPSAYDPFDAAYALVAEARRLDPDARVAVVVWLGYDPPEAINLQAVRSERAAAGAAALARFVDGLRVTTAPGTQISLVCHSYGSVVCAGAVRRGPSTVDDLVALAAPGMDVPDRAALVGAVRVWAGRGTTDPVRFTPFVRVAGLGHGPDPTSPSFGAAVFATGPVAGHSGYFRPGTESLTNLARILLGRVADVSCVD